MTRALLEQDFSGVERLFLSCGGLRVEVGRSLGVYDRTSLHARLRELLRPGWQNTRPEPAARAALRELPGE